MKPELRLRTQALATLRRFSMLPTEGRVVVGLSGGADSVALLHLLHSLPGEGHFRFRLEAAHVHHGLRGSADADEAFCTAFCARLGIPLHVTHIDAQALATAKGIGLEEAGRNARYAFFAQFGCTIALAHTLGDRAETFLLHLRRGTSLRGLCSIPPLRALPNGATLIRPLIDCTRAQIEDYCAAHRLAHCTDESNFDTRFRRNYLRHEVLPLLQLHPAALRRMFQSLEADEAYLSQAAASYAGNLLNAPEALRYRLLRQNLVAAGREPTTARMVALEQQLQAESQVCFFNESGGANPHLVRLSEDFIKNLSEMHKEDLANCLDCDTIKGVAVAGRRKSGDCMRPVHGAGTKSFKKLCQEHGIPPPARQNLALLRDDEGLIWLEGVGCAHRCRITARTTRAAKVRCTT
ncbi:MAG: tRNA lysidine(34) synthetase TilS [Oscillospiraceae bacterium]|jgi:tRNA(Ile)-lysidine synthase|nr:tRNA lysidine(34) synthetase TilS [Oscillospiraceae bacterium]